MNTIDSETAKALISRVSETRDGMFVFLNQARNVLDMTAHHGESQNESGVTVEDFSVYSIDVYKRAETFADDCDIMNFSYMTKFDTSLFSQFDLVDTYYFDSATNAHLGFAELSARFNHF